MHQTIIDLDPTLSSYGAGVPTHHVHIAQGALAAAEDLMAQALPVGCWPYACHIFSGRSSSAIAALLESSVKTTPLCASHWRFGLHTPADRSTLPHDCRQIRRLDLKACKSSRLTAFTSLLDTPYSVEAAQLIDQSAHLLEDVAERLPSRIPDSVGKLIGSLVLSGLSMSVPALPSCR